MRCMQLAMSLSPPVRTPPHVADIKARYPRTILLVQDGGNYRAYGDDAVAVEQVTGRTTVDVVTGDHTIATLLQRGYQVAICSRIGKDAA